MAENKQNIDKFPKVDYSESKFNESLDTTKDKIRSDFGYKPFDLSKQGNLNVKKGEIVSKEIQIKQQEEALLLAELEGKGEKGEVNKLKINQIDKLSEEKGLQEKELNGLAASFIKDFPVHSIIPVEINTQAVGGKKTYFFELNQLEDALGNNESDKIQENLKARKISAQNIKSSFRIKFDGNTPEEQLEINYNLPLSLLMREGLTKTLSYLFTLSNEAAATYKPVKDNVDYQDESSKKDEVIKKNKDLEDNLSKNKNQNLEISIVKKDKTIETVIVFFKKENQQIVISKNEGGLWDVNFKNKKTRSSIEPSELINTLNSNPETFIVI